MRVAVISDIHANLVALTSVLSDIEGQRVDRLVCLGDVADLGPEPSKTLALLRETDCPIIQGNHDPFVHDDPMPPALVAISDWCRDQLSAEERTFLKELPESMTIQLGHGQTLLCVHGSPRSYSEGMFSGQSNSEMAEILADVTANVVVCGHTHVQMFRRHQKTLVVNAGSVGCPFEEIYSGKEPRVLPWSEYAIIESSEGGVSVELRRVEFDVVQLVERIRSSSMPGANEWAHQWARRSFMPVAPA